MISHIGFRINSYIQFKRTGSLENLPYYFAKTTFAQLFWSVPIYFVAGLPYLMAWYSAIFIATALIRDFNWRGHGGNFRKFKKTGWEFDKRSHALNQHFYGYIASEWHDNHHNYPMSANTGFLPGQVDIAFQIIKLMHKVGIVESYVDARPIFEKECLGSKVISA
jgi:stearoyl-CoA desaturase (delta-9 desaturase)